MMIQMAKIHLATSNGMGGFKVLDHLSKAIKLTAVKVSAT